MVIDVQTEDFFKCGTIGIIIGLIVERWCVLQQEIKPVVTIGIGTFD